MTTKTFVRDFHPGMGQAVAERTILRKKVDGKWETWEDVAERVAKGNSLLFGDSEHQKAEYETLKRFIAKGLMITSGRHLQHGDDTQPTRNMEIFTNCFGGSTKIMTQEQGSVCIETVVGKTVTIRTKDGTWKKALVSHHGQQATQKVTFRSKHNQISTITQEVICTSNHRWFLQDGSVTDNLQVGDCLINNPEEMIFDPQAVVHGIIFGDGSGHYKNTYGGRNVGYQGTEYPSIRVCDKPGPVKDEIVKRLNDLGFDAHYPNHSQGDPVYYLGRQDCKLKHLPHTLDPTYIAGFIHGWWLADGSKTHIPNRQNDRVISTSNKDFADWLCEHACIAGYTVVGLRIHPSTRKGAYPNAKDLYSIRLKKNAVRRVFSIVPTGITEDVYCLEEPETSSFMLSNGLITGNCSSAATSFILFYNLLNGSGVGRSYDDEIILVNWDHAPNVRCVLSESHPDFDWQAHESVRDAKHKYGSGKDVMWFEVPDSREGWAKALEIWENAAFEKIHKDKILILDFSKVRPKGSPIGGMQNRPSSGPVALMNAFQKANSLRNAGIAPWLQAMYIDHYFAECVLVGGARRAARIATKSWRDKSIFEFIQVKRPIEFIGKTELEIAEIKKKQNPMGFLWSSNNSIMVDKEFWDLIKMKGNHLDHNSELAKHARKVFELLTLCSYADGTGEPGIINVDRLVQNDKDWTDLTKGDYIISKKYQVEDDTQILLSRLAKRAKKMGYHTIVNPCSEISFLLLGAFCVIADLCPLFADSLDEIIEACKAQTRFLMRVNTMDSIYKKEVNRTQRIGVGLTGIHEFAWKFFGYGFYDLIDEKKSQDFWAFMGKASRAVQEEAVAYAKVLGVNVPHTALTVKPAGCMDLDTVIKTSHGNMSFREIFVLNGIDLDNPNNHSQQWFDVSIPMQVFDSDNNQQSITKLFVNGNTPTIQITLEDGSTIKVSYGHQFLTDRGWVRADCLLEDDNILQY